MTNRQWLNSLSDEVFANWFEDFAESYTTFWIAPFDHCDFSPRGEDLASLLLWLKSEHVEEVGF